MSNRTANLLDPNQTFLFQPQPSPKSKQKKANPTHVSHGLPCHSKRQSHYPNSGTPNSVTALASPRSLIPHILSVHQQTCLAPFRIHPWLTNSYHPTATTPIPATVTVPCNDQLPDLAWLLFLLLLHSSPFSAQQLEGPWQKAQGI